MTLPELHPDLDGHMPLPVPICCGCQATEADDVVLVKLHSSVFICGSCAVGAAWDAVAETGRRTCMALLDCEPTAPMRSA